MSEAIKLYMQEKCTLDIDDAEVYLIPQKEAGLGANLGTSWRLSVKKTAMMVI